MAANRSASKRRCTWCGTNSLMVNYHDREWGVPLHDDRKLFELLILEGAQAGLTWQTILSKRDGYRKAFADFDPRKVAAFGPRDVRRLLADPGIVRHRAKVAAAVTNAKAFLSVQAEFGSFDAYLWRFVEGKPIDHRIERLKDIPVSTDASRAISRDLAKRGFKFVGPTICYAFMQAAGLVNDHERSCFRYSAVRRMSVTGAGPAPLRARCGSRRRGSCRIRPA
jgi:DNA-3-methyladenine glycosylase I